MSIPGDHHRDTQVVDILVVRSPVVGSPAGHILAVGSLVADNPAGGSLGVDILDILAVDNL